MPFYKWSEMKSDFITPSYSRGEGPAIKGETIEEVTGAALAAPVAPER